MQPLRNLWGGAGAPAGAEGGQEATKEATHEQQESPTGMAAAPLQAAASALQGVPQVAKEVGVRRGCVRM